MEKCINKITLKIETQKLSYVMKKSTFCRHFINCKYNYPVLLNVKFWYEIRYPIIMSAHVLLNSLELRKSDKMQCLLSILSLFCNKFNKFNNISA